MEIRTCRFPLAAHAAAELRERERPGHGLGAVRERDPHEVPALQTQGVQAPVRELRREAAQARVPA